VSESIETLKTNVSLFKTESIEALKKIFKKEESSGWNYKDAKDDVNKNNNLLIKTYNYRPLDFRKIVYTGSSSGFIGRSRSIVMKHFTLGENLGLCLMRQFFQDTPYSHIYITNSMIDERTMYSNRGGTYLFPLYLYPENNAQQALNYKQPTTNRELDRTPNLNKEIVNKIVQSLGLTFIPEQSGSASLSLIRRGTEGEVEFAPIDLLDYIYAILHSPTYREKYKEFLKIDFPRVPYPKDKKTFWQLVKLGGELRQIHLLESETVNKFITTFPIDGNNAVEKIKFEPTVTLSLSKGDLVNLGKVWINSTQYFDEVPQVAWEFYIGGYQPAQKWLKDRKGRTLNYDDIQHYQKIIVALSETDRLMKEIDKIGF
jgi:predicted helicase